MWEFAPMSLTWQEPNMTMSRFLHRLLSATPDIVLRIRDGYERTHVVGAKRA